MTEFSPQGYVSDLARTEEDDRAARENDLQATKEGPGQAKATALTIAAGLVTPTVARHRVDTEAAAATDELDRMLLTNHPDGRLVLISSVANARKVTVRHGSSGDGNFLLKTGADFVLDTVDYWLLVERDGTSWKEVDRWPRPSAGVDISIALPRGYIVGLLPSNNATNPATQIDISAGTARSADDTADLSLKPASAPFTKLINAPWAAGSGNGGMTSSKTVQPNTTYFIFAALFNENTDFGFDPSPTGSNLAADHGAVGLRRIGVLLTGGDSSILAWGHVIELAGGGIRCIYEISYTDRESTSIVSNLLIPLTLPVGIRLGVEATAQLNGVNASSAISLGHGDDATTRYAVCFTGSLSNIQYFNFSGFLRTNLNGEVRWGASGTPATLARFITRGWVDERRA